MSTEGRGWPFDEEGADRDAGRKTTAIKKNHGSFCLVFVIDRTIKMGMREPNVMIEESTLCFIFRILLIE